MNPKLLGFVHNVDLNKSIDTPISIDMTIFNANAKQGIWAPSAMGVVVYYNPSASLAATLAEIEIRTAPDGGGALVCDSNSLGATVLIGLTDRSKYVGATNYIGTLIRNPLLYARPKVLHGSSVTISVAIFGVLLPFQE